MEKYFQGKINTEIISVKISKSKIFLDDRMCREKYFKILQQTSINFKNRKNF